MKDNMPKSVLIVGSHPKRGGSVGGPSYYCANLAQALSKHMKVTILSPSLFDKETVMMDGSVEVIFLPRKKSKVWHRIIKVRAMANNYDIIHINGVKLFPIKYFTNKPVVMTVHGYLTLENVANGKYREGSMKFKMHRWIERKAITKVDKIIAVDKRIKNWIIHDLNGDDEKVTSISNAVNATLFRPDNDTKLIRDRHKLGNKPIILFFKGLSPKNGPEVIIQAMPQIINNHPDSILLIAGDGPLKEQLIIQVSELDIGDNVLFLGQINSEDAPYYYASSTIVVVPSVHVSGVEEATSLTMLEGMASAKPVVASNIGGLKETISNREKIIGILFKEKNSVELANTIIELLNDENKRQDIGNNARQFIESESTWDYYVLKILDIYKSML